MNTSKTKFKIKKNNNIIRLPKVLSKQKSEVIAPNKSAENFFKIDSYKFSSAEQKIIKKNFSADLNSEIFASQFSPDDSKCITTLLDGRIYFMNSKKPASNYFHTVNEHAPITALTWKDNLNFLLGDTEGKIYEYKTSRENNSLTLVNEYMDTENDQVFTLDHNPELNLHIYAGKNMNINLLNAANNKIVRKYEKGDSYQIGHTNRIFCVKFIEKQVNMFLSAGWDGTMFLWDIRVPKAVNSVFGPSVSGDAVDVKDNLILTGSYRDKNPLELYDIRNFKRICEVGEENKVKPLSYVSSCKFNKNKNNDDYIIAGSCITGQVDIYKKEIVFKRDVTVTDIGCGVYSCGFTNIENKFYMGTSKGKFTVYHFFNM